MRSRVLISILLLVTVTACKEDGPTVPGTTEPPGDTTTTPSTPARCAESALDDYVLQCAATEVIDGDGGVVTLPDDEDGWVTMSVVVPAGALPTSTASVALTLERIDAGLYFDETGLRCIPGLDGEGALDAPMYGQCLRVTSEPVLTEPLIVPALIEICIDPYVLDGIKFDEDQEGRLQILRSGGDVVQGLPNVDATTCGAPPTPGPSLAGMLPVPAEGLLRHTAIAVNRLGRWLGPRPLLAHGAIRLAGAASEFSTFRWGLPGGMVSASEGIVVQELEDGSQSYDVPVTVRVVDSGADAEEPSTIEGASVHFSGEAGVSEPDVTTGEDGVASTTWTVPSTGPGVYTLRARARGLLAGPVPDHDERVEFGESIVEISATVVGPPSGATQSPAADEPLEGSPGTALADPLTINVVDASGEPVRGWPVTWTTTCDAAEPNACDGAIEGDAATDDAGRASAVWTLARTPGENTATARVGSESFALDPVSWSVTTESCAEIAVDGIVDDGEWDCPSTTVETFSVRIGHLTESPAEVRVRHDGSDLYMMVRFEREILGMFNSLRVEFDNTLDGSTPDDDVIRVYAGDAGAPGSFRDEHMTRNGVEHPGAFGFGVADSDAGGSSDGAGAVGNDGTHTVFELSHPLSGDPGIDFELSPDNPVVGYFLQLRTGQGDWARSHFPGFRDYREIRYR